MKSDLCNKSLAMTVRKNSMKCYVETFILWLFKTWNLDQRTGEKLKTAELWCLKLVRNWTHRRCGVSKNWEETEHILRCGVSNWEERQRTLVSQTNVVNTVTARATNVRKRPMIESRTANAIVRKIKYSLWSYRMRRGALEAAFFWAHKQKRSFGNNIL